jgi:hypothetical protein
MYFSYKGLKSKAREACDDLSEEPALFFGPGRQILFPASFDLAVREFFLKSLF